MCKNPPDPNVETVMWNRKEHRLADRLTSCSPEHSCYNCRLLQNRGSLREVNYPTSGVVPYLGVPLSHTDSPWNRRAPTQGVPLTVQWISFPGVRSSPCWGHRLQLCLRVSEYLWFQGVCGGRGGWKHCSLHRAVAMPLKALTALSSLHHSVSLSTHWCLAFIAQPLRIVLCNLFGTEVLSF